MRKSVFTFAFLFFVQLLPAQRLTIEQAQQLARENYPLIKKYDLIAQTEQFTLSNVSKGWLPQVTASAQATLQSSVVALPESLEKMMSGAGTEVLGLKKDQYKIALDVSQMVYDGGSIASGRDVARARSRVDEAATDVGLYALRQRVNDIFFSLLLTEERLSLNNEVQVLLQSSEDRLSSMVKGGVATESDADAVRVERLTAVQQHTQLESQRSALRRVLALYIGREFGEIAKPVELTPSLTVARPELRHFDSQILLAEARDRALASGLRPKVSIFAQGFYGYPGFNMYEDMFAHDFSFNGLIGARIVWNIGALYTYRNDRRNLQAERSMVENARETFLFNSALQTTQESETVAGYRRMIADDDRIISLRRSVRMAAESKLAHGIVDVNSLVQEITRENQASINRSTHEIEMLQHMYSLDNITGQ